jgi:cytochrome c553
MDLLDRLVLAFFATIPLAGCGPIDRRAADRFAATGELVALSGGDAGANNACIACHGIDGRGNGAGAPRLAGLDRGYQEAQLQAYADGRREHPEMQWIAKHLRPAQRQAVSAHYASLPFEAEAQAMPADSFTARLYQQGDPARGLKSCASCHGIRGEGLGPANPPLAGQPAAYIAEQLERWRHSARRNDPENMMLRISQALSRPESAVLANYAAALPGDPRRPESLEASPAARRGDPRNDVSATPQREAE